MSMRSIIKAALFCIVFTIILIGLSFLKNLLPASSERWAHGIVGTIAAFITTYFFLKYDKKSFADIELKYSNRTIVRFIAGILAGILIMGALAFSVIWFSGFIIETNPESNIPHFILMTLPLFLLAFMEEVAFRGYPLMLLKNKTGIRTSILITSVLFGLYHIVNGWTVMNAILGAGVWGIIFATAAVYSNGIAFPTGIHYAANLTTSAFATSAGHNLWILKQANGESAENYQSSFAESVIPNICMLLFGVLLMEICIKRRKPL